MYRTEKTIFLLAIILFINKPSFAQTNSCIDDGNKRIKYSAPIFANSSFYTRKVSDNTNYIMGGFKDANDSGIGLSKTYFGSVMWAKKYHSAEYKFTIENAVALPDSSIIAYSGSGSFNNQFLIRYNANGNVLWAKKYKLTLPGVVNSGVACDDILKYYKNYIYFSKEFFDPQFKIYRTVAKLDLGGNIIWSKTLSSNFPVGQSDYTQAPLVKEDTVTIISNSKYLGVFGSFDSVAVIITKLHANTGNIISVNRITTAPDNYIKGIEIMNSQLFPDNTLGFTGHIYNRSGNGITRSYYGIPFALQTDAGGNFINAKYFANPLNVGVVFGSITQKKEIAFWLYKYYKYTENRFYILNVDSNLSVKNTKIFFYPQIFNQVSAFEKDANGNENFNFTVANVVPNQHEVQYFSVNNLLSDSSQNCFGKDTSFFQPKSFTTIKDSSFSWPYQVSGLLYAAPFSLTETPFTIGSEIVCSVASICDTIKIKGNKAHCLSDPTATFTLYKNPQCLRKTTWVVDSAFIKIISRPNDTTINVKFLKNFHGYIRAVFEGCTLKDSFYIDVSTAKQSLYLGADTMHCPNKTITLNAGTGFKTYKWQNNSTDSVFTATQAGTYFVKAVDSCGNIFRDTIIIRPMDIVFNLVCLNPICLYDTATVLLDSKLKNYLWSPANAAVQDNNKLKLFPDKTTLFNISAQRFTDCILSDTLLVKIIDCPTYIYIPTAFSPNNDGINDIFKPIVIGILEQYNFSVYNKYGQQVFTTTNITNGWDGKINGIVQQAGAFVWFCRYKFFKKEVFTKKGSVILIN